jgi:hypothetical protein
MSSTDVLGQMKKFIIDNNIVGTSAGVCIALAAKDGIQSLVGDIIIPIIVMLLHRVNGDALAQYLPVDGPTKLNIPSFIKHMITFVLIIFISFLFVKVAFEYLLNIKGNGKDDNKPSTIPNDKQNVSNFTTLDDSAYSFINSQ